MPMSQLHRRLDKLEAARPHLRPVMTAAQIEAARLVYEDLLANPPPPPPEMVAYWQSVDLHPLAADTGEYLRGGPASWDRPEFRQEPLP